MPNTTSIMPPSYTIPTIDLAGQTHRQIVVDKEEGQYLGHVSTVLLEDQQTIIAVYPKGHGGGSVVMKGTDNSSCRGPTRCQALDSFLWIISDPHGSFGRRWSCLEPTGSYRRFW